MRIRDRVVLGVLAGSVLLAALVRNPLGPWASLVAVIAGVLVAPMAYRLKPPAFGLHDDPLDASRSGPPDEDRLARTEASIDGAETPGGRNPRGSA